MERIERYIEAASSQLAGTKEEVDSLKEQMRTHIYDMIDELKGIGYSEEDSITIVVKKFSEENKIEESLLKDFRFSKKFKAPKKFLIAMCILLLAAVSIVTVYVGYKHKNVNTWSENLLAPDGITIRIKMGSTDTSGASISPNMVVVEDNVTIDKLLNFIENAKSAKSCTMEEAGNFKPEDIKFSIGTIVNSPIIPANTLTTVNVLKDGTFFAGKMAASNNHTYIKGKLGENELKFLEEVYENSPIIK